MADGRVTIGPSAGDPLGLFALQLLDGVVADRGVSVILRRSPFTSTTCSREDRLVYILIMQNLLVMFSSYYELHLGLSR